MLNYFAAPYVIQKKLRRPLQLLTASFFLFVFVTVFFQDAQAQKKNSAFLTGERLVYKIKFGFVKLGTLIIETGKPAGGSRVNARMKFWTAQVPFLDSKDVVDDIIDST